MVAWVARGGQGELEWRPRSISGAAQNEELVVAGHRHARRIRLIYFWDESSETLYMLYAYRKNAQET
jgi:hypothetical protein